MANRVRLRDRDKFAFRSTNKQGNIHSLQLQHKTDHIKDKLLLIRYLTNVANATEFIKH